MNVVGVDLSAYLGGGNGTEVEEILAEVAEPEVAEAEVAETEASDNEVAETEAAEAVEIVEEAG